MKQLLLLLLISSSSAIAQTTSLPSDTTQWMNFWVGEWQLNWIDANGKAATGENSITKLWDGKVIQENFKGLTGQNAGYEGKSWSVYDAKTKKWKQTWVDSQGGYLDLVGGVEGENRYFERQTINRNGKTVTMRMTFHDITPNRFVWDWASSTDDKKTWQPIWQITYTRKK